MKKGEKSAVILAVVICAMVLFGEIAVYEADAFYHYDTDVQADGSYTVSSSGSQCYSAVLTDNGSFEAVSTVYLYYDGDYGAVVNGVTVEVGAKPLTQEYYLSQLANTLDYRGLNNYEYVNAEELAAVLSDTLEHGDATGTAVVDISGVLPATVYSGSDSDLVLQWIVAGGSLYWAGGLLGQYIGNADGTVTKAAGDYQTLFFETDCLNTSNTTVAYSDVSDNNYRNDLSLANNSVMYAVNTSALTAGTYLAVGYTEDSYASICFVQCGSGMVCILGGNYSNNQRSDFGTVLCAGLCWCSDELDCETGTVTRTTVSGILNIPNSHGNLVAYVLLGGYFSVYGESFILADE